MLLKATSIPELNGGFVRMRIKTSNKNFILDVGMEKQEGIYITHSCIPPLLAIMCCMYTVYSGMQEWVIQIPSIPILVSVLFPSLHLKYFRIKFLLLVPLVLPCDVGHEHSGLN